MINRFWNVGVDGEIMAAAAELDVKLLKLEDGQIAGSFKLAGHFGADLCADDDDEPTDPQEALDFAARLMRQFQRGGNGQGGAPC